MRSLLPSTLSEKFTLVAFTAVVCLGGPGYFFHDQVMAIIDATVANMESVGAQLRALSWPGQQP